jgi:hypothetical protein
MGFSGSPVFASRVGELTHLVQKISFEQLDAGGFNKVNYDPTTTINATLQAIANANNGVVPQGLLGASVVVTKGNSLIGAPTPPATPGTTPVDLTEQPKGILLRDVAGFNAFEGTVTTEANKPTYYAGPANMLRVTLYETRRRNQPGVPPVGQHSANPADDLVYQAGDILYVDTYSGLLTNDVPVDNAGNNPKDNPAGASPAAAFDPLDVRNGIHPEPIAEVTELNLFGTTDLAIVLKV